MLIKKNIEKGSIIAIKLVTGDEIVTKVVSHDVGANILVVSKPIAVAMAPNGSVAFIPYMVAAPDDVELTINMDNIVTYADAREELKNAYIQNTTGIVPTGIVPAGSGSVPASLIKA